MRNEGREEGGNGKSQERHPEEEIWSERGKKRGSEVLRIDKDFVCGH